MRLGFVGLGALGTPMATRLAATQELIVWNRTTERAAAFEAANPAARVASSLDELARNVDAVVTCLSTSADVAMVLEGAEGMWTALSPGSLVIDCTSGDPAVSRRLATALEARKIGFVDAPVSGGPPLAAEGRLTVMCGGSPANVECARQLLAPCAGKFLHMGAVGTGHAMKAVNNALLALNILAAGEGLVALAKLGISPRNAVEVLNASSGRSFVTEALIPERVLTGSYPPLFRLALLEKDIGIAHDVAAAAEVDDPLLAAARELYRTLRSELGESADYLEPIRQAEMKAGVELRG